jgi:hypothetical protein
MSLAAAGRWPSSALPSRAVTVRKISSRFGPAASSGCARVLERAVGDFLLPRSMMTSSADFLDEVQQV